MKSYARRAAMVTALMLPVAATAAEPARIASLFGARETVRDISLAPDGRHAAVITAGPGHGDVLVSLDTATGAITRVTSASGDPLGIRSCGWASSVRLVCTFAGIARVAGVPVAYTRLMGFDADGRNPRYLGRRVEGGAARPSQFDAEVIDWRDGDGSVLMMRNFIPGDRDGTVASPIRDGRGVELVDTATGRATIVEAPTTQASRFFADGNGTVRLKAEEEADPETRVMTGTTVYSYRPSGSRAWKPFSRTSVESDGLVPLGVDGGRNLAYAARSLNGRQALYSVALDGSMKQELVSSDPAVDVAAVVSIGRHGRIIGATYVTDRRQTDYFDPAYRKLAAGLAKALPKTPLIRFVDASADEGQLLIFAGSDVDPGAYYLYTKATRQLDFLLAARPELAGLAMSAMTPVTFKATDGTAIPAYLTLPPGGAKRGLPAIVMPHGGPGYRDEWGFDWLAQYFAQAGYAVLQPNFRGSTGYGDAWYARNGYRSWETAIGDVADAGRWLVAEGIADPSKLAIVGWSYGGYAALQANVVDPDLFKAVVAIAPVTDLAAVKRSAASYVNRRLVEGQIGSGSAIAAGSPARHADRIKAPVLLFHGDADLNVDLDQSRRMDAALRRAGKASTLIVLPKLDHQLDDSDTRTRMLEQADAFLRKSMTM